MKKYFQFILLLAISINLKAQNTFYSTFLLDSSGVSANSIVTSNDTLFLSCNSSTGEYVAALDSSQNLLWVTKTVSDSLQSSSQQMCMLSDNSLLALYVGHFSSYENILAVKISKQGNILWRKHYYYNSVTNIKMSTVVALPDSGFMMSGGGDVGNFFTIRCDANGNDLWNKIYSSTAPVGSVSKMMLVDNGTHVLLAGEFFNGNSYELRILKIDLYGNPIWQEDYDMSGYFFNVGALKETNGGYILTASGSELILKTDTSGNLLWDHLFQTSQYGSEYSAIEFLSDSSIIAGGMMNYRIFQNTYSSSYIAHLDQNGNYLSGYAISGPATLSQYGSNQILAMTKSSSSNIIYCTGSRNGGTLFTISSVTGNACLQNNLTHTTSSPAINVTSQNLIVANISLSSTNFYSLPYSPTVTFTNQCNSLTTGNNSSSQIKDNCTVIFPQPSDNEINIHFSSADENKFSQLEVFSIDGKLIEKQTIEKQEDQKINCEGWDAGIYFILLSGNGEIPLQLIAVVE